MNLPCADDPELFFAEAERWKRQAKRLCADCPIRVECLESSRNEFYGIWGGLDEKERVTLFHGGLLSA